MAFFEVKIKGLERVLKGIELQIRDILTPKEMQELAEQVRDAIYKRTKAGRGVEYDVVENPEGRPKEVKLPDLSPGYKKQRKRKGVKGEFGTPNKSNLTNTGQMLNAMKIKITPKGATVFIAGSSRSDSDLTNEDVALYASILRPFFHLSDKQAKVIEARINRLVRDKLRRSARR